MKSRIIGQIHDDITIDADNKELSDVLQMAKEIMCEDIRKVWEWIIVPLEIECSFSDVNWFEVKEVKV